MGMGEQGTNSKDARGGGSPGPDRGKPLRWRDSTGADDLEQDANLTAAGRRGIAVRADADMDPHDNPDEQSDRDRCEQVTPAQPPKDMGATPERPGRSEEYEPTGDDGGERVELSTPQTREPKTELSCQAVADEHTGRDHCGDGGEAPLPCHFLSVVHP